MQEAFIQIFSVVLFCAIGSYLICGIPFGLLFTRLFGKQDLREKGSGNIGSTNALRVGGKLVGVLTFTCDVLKGWLAVYISMQVISMACGGNKAFIMLGGAWSFIAALIFLSAVFGHVFSIYLRFHGGKGIACGLGALFALSPKCALIALALFLVFVIPTRYVSLGSMVAAISIPLSVGCLYKPQPFTILILSFVSLVVLWAHRKNIVALLNKEERKVSFCHKKDV